jgi:hypothetical protein
LTKETHLKHKPLKRSLTTKIHSKHKPLKIFKVMDRKMTQFMEHEADPFLGYFET